LLSKPCVHAIHALCYLSRQDGHRLVSARDVTESVGVPSDHGAKILQCLAGAGLVVSVRGRSGGYALSRQLEDISILDVLQAVHGPSPGPDVRPKACPMQPGQQCSIDGNLLRLHEQLQGTLAGYSLASVLTGQCFGDQLMLSNAAG
jgi:Rrf2 family protein